MLACRACSALIDSEPFAAREAWLGSNETFQYVECATCGTVQIVRVPADLERYYPQSSYRPAVRTPGRVRRFLRRQRSAAVLGSRWNLIGRLMISLYGSPDWASWLPATGARHDSRILDVGSGDGELLVALESVGFRDLTGIDPFIADDRAYPGGVRVFKRVAEKHMGEYDLITLHHSLEHVSDPIALLREVNRLLHPSGTALVRVPLAGNYGWRMYREHWGGLDPPRHLVVPSVEGMRRMAAAAGFRIDAMAYEDVGLGYAISEQSRAGHSFGCYLKTERARACHTADELARFRQIAAERNAAGDGDSGAFYLKHA